MQYAPSPFCEAARSDAAVRFIVCTLHDETGRPMMGNRRLIRRRARRGMQTFEWILVLTLLAIGIIGGLAAIRNTIIDRFAKVAKDIGAVEVSRCLEGSSSCPVPTGLTVERAWWASADERPSGELSGN